MSATRVLKMGAGLLTLAAALIVAPAAHGQSPSGPIITEGRKLPLREQLIYGLKATTKGDKEFIDKVVLKVDEGVLPRPLVDSTFLWARERAAAKSPTRELRPMVYFRPALIARAQRMRLPF